MPKFVWAALVLLTLAACNTMQGAGQDISAAGSAITDEAQETERGM